MDKVREVFQSEAILYSMADPNVGIETDVDVEDTVVDQTDEPDQTSYQGGHEKPRNQRFFKTFVVFYAFILLSWLFFMIFNFTTFFSDQSFVLAHYLLTGEQVAKSALQSSIQLTVVDWLVKINLLMVSIAISTIFLIYNILPKLKNLNAGWLILSAIAAYFPTLLTIINFFSQGSVRGNAFSIFSSNLTFFQFLTLTVLNPLNYAVFFYFYYILDNFVLKKEDK